MSNFSERSDVKAGRKYIKFVCAYFINAPFTTKTQYYPSFQLLLLAATSVFDCSMRQNFNTRRWNVLKEAVHETTIFLETIFSTEDVKAAVNVADYFSHMDETIKEAFQDHHELQD